MKSSSVPSPLSLPRDIDAGEWSEGHVQGIALDTERKYMYYSFTTVLVKTDLEGNLIGTVSGLTGHLGCISFNDEDGRVYGSIEYKHDVIGQNIMKRKGACRRGRLLYRHIRRRQDRQGRARRRARRHNDRRLSSRRRRRFQRFG